MPEPRAAIVGAVRTIDYRYDDQVGTGVSESQEARAVGTIQCAKRGVDQVLQGQGGAVGGVVDYVGDKDHRSRWNVR